MCQSLYYCKWFCKLAGFGSCGTVAFIESSFSCFRLFSLDIARGIATISKQSLNTQQHSQCNCMLDASYIVSLDLPLINSGRKQAKRNTLHHISWTSSISYTSYWCDVKNFSVNHTIQNLVGTHAWRAESCVSSNQQSTPNSNEPNVVVYEVLNRLR